MSFTQFAMVEELASLVKDNLPCKHLVLTLEEALVNFLQDENTSSDGIFELEPMNSYNRLLLHRLAEIFGSVTGARFLHESVGEGDDRHLILQRCPETSIPPVLVSDIIWNYDEPQTLTSHQILRRKEATPVSQTNTPSLQHSLEKRKEAYLIARERIFSMNLEDMKGPVEQKPRSVPVVARRMIAHALGQRIHSKNQDGLPNNSTKDGMGTDVLHDQNKNCKQSNRMEDSEESIEMKRNSVNRVRNDSRSSASSFDKRNVDKLSEVSRSGKHGNGVSNDHIKRENFGAAKRIFAHALGVHPGKNASVSRSRESKKSDAE